MTETIVQKVNKLSIFSGGPESPPSSRDFIRNLDYQQLENQYQIHKYYPTNIHNEISTPTLRDQLQNTPIYAKANKAVKKPSKQRCSSLNPYNKTRRFDTKQSEGFDTLIPIAGGRRGNERHPEVKNLSEVEKREEHEKTEVQEKQDQTKVHENEFVFNNPFDDGKIIHRGIGHKSSKRQNSIASRMLNFVRGEAPLKQEKSEGDVALHRSRSFDQTKSNLTSTRIRKKSIFPKLKQSNESRRGSEQLSMYLFSTNLKLASNDEFLTQPHNHFHSVLHKTSPFDLPNTVFS